MTESTTVAALPGEVAIAVVLPAHRQPELLAEALGSVLRQRGAPPTAAVVVDDGCPFPDTALVAREMAAAHPGRIFVLRRRNAGLSAARNAGVEFALAAFPALRAVYFLDADNRLRPPFLACAFEAMQAAAPEVGWFYPDIDEIGRTQNFATGGPYMLLPHLTENYCEAGSLVRREIFDAGLRFDETMRAGFEDWDFWLQCAGRGFVGQHLRDAGFLYRRRPESMLADAERQRAVLLAGMHRKHAALLKPKALLRQEHREAPRFALFAPDRPEVQLLLDPALPPREAVPTEAMRGRMLAAAEAMEARFLPPVLAFATEAALDLLRRHRLVRGLFWLAETELREAADAVAFEIAAGPPGELAVEPLPPGGVGEAPVVLLRSRTLVFPGEEEGELESLGQPGPKLRLRRFRVTLPATAAAEAASPRPFRQLLMEAASLRGALRRRTAVTPGWRTDARGWRDEAGQRAYALSGLGAVLPLLPPEQGRRDFGFVLPVFAFGGVEKVALAQAAALRARGWRTHLFVLGSGAASLPGEALAGFESVNLLPDPGAEDLDWNRLYFGVGTAAFGEREGAPDALGLLAGMDAVLNTHSLGGHALMGRLRRLGTRTFCGLHLIERTAWGAPMGAAHNALPYEHAYDGVTVISAALRRWCIAQGVPPAKLHLIPNAPAWPADPARIAAALAARRERPREGQSGKLRALFLGRLDRQKGLDRLAALVARTREAVEWRVVGRPVLEGGGGSPPELGGIAIEPPVSDPAALDALYAWADAVVLPSRFEGVPLTVLEAQRMGCAVLATDVGAVPEVVADGVDGLLVRHDQPEPAILAALVDALHRLAADPGLRAALGGRAAARLAGAGWAETMRPFLDHLDQICPVGTTA